MNAAIRLAVFAQLALATSVQSTGFESIGPDGGRIDGFAQAPSNPDRLYCLLHAQGVLRSNDRGTTWQRVDTGMAMDTALQCVAISPTNADVVLIGDPGGDRVQRSTDGGQTWTPILMGGAWNTLAAIAFDPFDPSHVLAAIRQGGQTGIHRSTDGGFTWALVDANTPLEIAFHPGTQGAVLAGTTTGIRRSTDGGTTWSTVHPGWSSDLSFCAQAPARVWALSNNQVVRSTDGGLTFVAVSPLPDSFWTAPAGIAAHPVDASTVVVGQLFGYCGAEPCVSGPYRIQRSTNGGSTWSASSYVADSDPSDETFALITFDWAQPTTVWAVATNTANGVVKSGLLRSTDSGLSFSTWMNGIYGQAIRSVESDETGAVYARRNGNWGLWRAATAASTWQPRSTPDAYPYLVSFQVSHTTPGHLVECGYNFSGDSAGPLWANSSDGGQTWWPGDPPPTQTFVSSPLTLSTNYAIDETAYLWVNEWADGYVLHRSDNGTTFSASFPSFPAAGAAVDPADAFRLFAVNANTGAVQLSTDGGATWSSRSIGLPNAQPVGIYMDPADGDRLAVVYKTAGVYRSEDGGLAWQQVSIALPSAVVAADWEALADRFALATASDGVFITGMGLVTDGLSTRKLTSVVFEPIAGKVLVGTEYASVFSIDAPDPTAAPIVAETSGLQLEVSPNPSRGNATIRFATARDGEVRVDVFTVSGRRVATPYTGATERGTRVVTWDGHDASGKTVGSGVYFVRLRSGKELVTRRLVLTR